MILVLVETDLEGAAVEVSLEAITFEVRDVVDTLPSKTALTSLTGNPIRRSAAISAPSSWTLMRCGRNRSSAARAASGSAAVPSMCRHSTCESCWTKSGATSTPLPWNNRA